MLCVLVYVSFGHFWVPGAGNMLVKSCYYDCGNTTKARWYDRKYAVSPNFICSARFVEA